MDSSTPVAGEPRPDQVVSCSLRGEVKALARATFLSYNENVLSYARNTINDNIRKVSQYNAGYRDEQRSVGPDSKKFDGQLGRKHESLPGNPVKTSDSNSPALARPGASHSRGEDLRRASKALHSVTATSRKRKAGSSKLADPAPLQIAKAQPCPKYDAWVPVNEEFWISNEFMVQPYMPWVGDENSDQADALYRKMALESTQEDSEVSDGEVDEDGSFIEPENDDGWQVYDSISEQRRRQACREALTAVSSKFSFTNAAVLEAVVEELGLTTRERALKLFEVAENRIAQASVAASKRDAAAREAKRMSEAWLGDTGYGDMDEDQYADEARLPLEHFCFTCHVFLCPRHKGHNVEPVLPIKDLFVETRAAAHKKLKQVEDKGRQSSVDVSGLTPCGADCHLSPPDEQVPVAPGEDPAGVWSKEERLLLRESVAVFKWDCCNIAKIIGPSKSCRQTAAFMQIPNVDKALRVVVAEATMKRTSPECNRGRGSSAQVGDKREKPADSGTRERRVKNVKSVGKRKTTGSQSDEEPTEEVGDPDQEADFIPCLHKGPCDSKCPCYMKGLRCEATCGCNTGRWTVRGYEIPAGKGAVSNRKKVCDNRDWGCKCPQGSHCNTSACSCWEQQRSCDPDFCDHCQANLLPSQIMSDTRSCRNVGVLTKRHKKTIIGKSSVHGYGLFAGEVFEEGDLVGIYGGGIMDTRKADMIGHMYDFKDHTFFFDVTQTLVVDGGMLGMKSKFVNHVSGGSPQENCRSRCVRVRGMAHIALFAMRRVEVGEEFMFDYKFQDIIPVWAQKRHAAAGQVTPDRVKSERPGRYVKSSERKQARSRVALDLSLADKAIRLEKSTSDADGKGALSERKMEDPGSGARRSGFEEKGAGRNSSGFLESARRAMYHGAGSARRAVYHDSDDEVEDDGVEIVCLDSP